jgi:chemotaxis protein histidine kinase CheA
MQLSQDDRIKYKALYLQTARNYLQNMQLNISFLLKGEQIKIAIKQVHMDAHSLKSQGQIMGYNHIAKVSEIIENLFNKQENENSQVNKDVLIQIQADLCRLQDSLTEIEKMGKELDLTEVINKLEKVK